MLQVIRFLAREAAANLDDVTNVLVALIEGFVDLTGEELGSRQRESDHHVF